MTVAWLLTPAAVVGLIIATPGLNAQSWTEYTITKRQKSINLPTGAVLERTLVEARRADGTRVIAAGDSPGQWGFLGVREIENAPDGKRIHIEDTLGLTTTFYSRGARPPPTRDPLCFFGQISANAKPRLTGEEEIFGFKVVGIQTETGPLLTTVWKAPDLHCTELKMFEEKRDHTGDVDGRFEMTAVSIVMGTPNPALFQIPGTYLEKSPLEVEQARADGSGRRLPEGVQRLNERYLENHRQAGAP